MKQPKYPNSINKSDILSILDETQEGLECRVKENLAGQGVDELLINKFWQEIKSKEAVACMMQGRKKFFKLNERVVKSILKRNKKWKRLLGHLLLAGTVGVVGVIKEGGGKEDFSSVVKDVTDASAQVRAIVDNNDNQEEKDYRSELNDFVEEIDSGLARLNGFTINHDNTLTKDLGYLLDIGVPRSSDTKNQELYTKIKYHLNNHTDENIKLVYSTLESDGTQRGIDDISEEFIDSLFKQNREISKSILVDIESLKDVSQMKRNAVLKNILKNTKKLQEIGIAVEKGIEASLIGHRDLVNNPLLKELPVDAPTLDLSKQIASLEKSISGNEIIDLVTLNQIVLGSFLASLSLLFSILFEFLRKRSLVKPSIKEDEVILIETINTVSKGIKAVKKEIKKGEQVIFLGMDEGSWDPSDAVNPRILRAVGKKYGEAPDEFIEIEGEERWEMLKFPDDGIDEKPPEEDGFGVIDIDLDDFEEEPTDDVGLENVTFDDFVEVEEGESLFSSEELMEIEKDVDNQEELEENGLDVIDLDLDDGDYSVEQGPLSDEEIFEGYAEVEDNSKEEVVELPTIPILGKDLEKIINSFCKKGAEELGGLMGVTLKFENPTIKTTTKEKLEGNQILSNIKIEGEQGTERGYIITDIKLAIALGGTLIMLPENELEEAVSGECYMEEIDDSYGELVNIMAGSLREVLNEYDENIRVTRKGASSVIDDGNSNEINDQEYFILTVDVSINDDKCFKKGDSSKIRLLLPVKMTEKESTKYVSKKVVLDDQGKKVEPPKKESTPTVGPPKVKEEEAPSIQGVETEPETEIEPNPEKLVEVTRKKTFEPFEILNSLRDFLSGKNKVIRMKEPGHEAARVAVFQKHPKLKGLLDQYKENTKRKDKKGINEEIQQFVGEYIDVTTPNTPTGSTNRITIESINPKSGIIKIKSGIVQKKAIEI